MLSLYQFAKACDTCLPLWINHNGICDYYEDIWEAVNDNDTNAHITYITLDGEGELTLEIEV